MCFIGGMDMHERLQAARKRAGYSTAKNAADAFGWNEVTYRAHESGERGLKLTVAQKYATAFKVPEEWLWLGQGPADEDTKRILEVWARIPESDRDAARAMLESLAKKE